MTIFPQKREFIVDVTEMRREMGRFGLRCASDLDLPIGIAVTENLIGGSIADLNVIKRLHEATHITAWVTGNPVDGFFIVVPLSKDGEEAVRDGSFLPADPAVSHVCPQGEFCHAVYVGVYAGQTRDARRNIMQASATLRVQLFGTVACFARAATEDGERSMYTLGFGPIEGGLPDLFVQEPLTNSLWSAA
ncbi:MAG: hypothetical protein AAF950_05190 [Pseudomonadota bacterium]